MEHTTGDNLSLLNRSRGNFSVAFSESGHGGAGTATQDGGSVGLVLAGKTKVTNSLFGTPSNFAKSLF